MNNAKINVYKKYSSNFVKKYDGAKEFIRDKIEEICNNKKLSVEEVT